MIMIVLRYCFDLVFGQIPNLSHNNLFSLFVSCLQQQRLKLENVSTIMETTTTATATTTIQEKKKEPIEEVYKVCFYLFFIFISILL